jgi:hypothetical protein
MFSTSTLRLLQLLPTRHPILSSVWSQARCYTFLRPSLPPSGLEDSSEPRSTEQWGVLGSYATQKSPQGDTRSIDERWENKSNLAKQDLLQYPPANPYSGLDVLVLCDCI